MHSRLSFASLGVGLLLFGGAAAASIRAPNTYRPQRRADSDTPFVSPSTPLPKVEYIDDHNLTELAKPFLPKPINGMIRLPAFRPKDLQLANVAQLPKDVDQNGVSARDPDTFGPFPDPILRIVEPGDRALAPYTSMGKVFTRDGDGNVFSTCTGTMVGSRIFLTANHCIQDRPDDWSLDFAPGFDGTNPNLSPPLGKAVHADKCYGLQSGMSAMSAILDGRDYVVCVLSETLGLDVGYLGTNTPDSSNAAGQDMYLNHTWFSAGYPRDMERGEVLIRAERIAIQRVVRSGDNLRNKEFWTPPYPEHGWSGGPLYGIDPTTDDAQIIGIVSAFRHIKAQGELFTTALHSGGPKLTKLIAWARCEWPGWSGECEQS
jgi:hypothetical protein